MALLKKSEKVKPLKTASRGGAGGSVSALRPAQTEKLAPCLDRCPAGNDVRNKKKKKKKKKNRKSDHNHVVL